MSAKNKHTPAPWTVDVLDYVTNIESEHQTICTNVSNCDADLIAAAPDLLSTLELIKKIISSGEDVMQSLEPIVDTALLKAKGKL